MSEAMDWQRVILNQGERPKAFPFFTTKNGRQYVRVFPPWEQITRHDAEAGLRASLWTETRRLADIMFGRKASPAKNKWLYRERRRTHGIERVRRADHEWQVLYEIAQLEGFDADGRETLPEWYRDKLDPQRPRLPRLSPCLDGDEDRMERLAERRAKRRQLDRLNWLQVAVNAAQSY